MTSEEQIKLVGEIFGMEDMRHYPELDELVSEFLERVDRRTTMQSDPNVSMDILGEVDDIVCHRLRPALWERMEEFGKMSVSRKTTRTEKLNGEPTITKVPGELSLEDVFNSTSHHVIVLVGNSDCELSTLYDAYELVPGLLDSMVYLRLSAEVLEVVLKEHDRVLFSFQLQY